MDTTANNPRGRAYKFFLRSYNNAQRWGDYEYLSAIGVLPDADAFARECCELWDKDPRNDTEWLTTIAKHLLASYRASNNGDARQRKDFLFSSLDDMLDYQEENINPAFTEVDEGFEEVENHVAFVAKLKQIRHVLTPQQFHWLTLVSEGYGITEAAEIAYGFQHGSVKWRVAKNLAESGLKELLYA